MFKRFLVPTLASLMLLVSCGGDTITSGGSGGSGQTYRVKVMVSGLPFGESILLYNNQIDALNLRVNGALTQFPSALSSGDAYAVTVKEKPLGYQCSVSNGVGTASANISNVTILCKQNYTVSTIATFSNTNWDHRGNTLVMDTNGNFFLASSQEHVIYKITPSGVISVYAGSINGYLDANSTLAQFSFPQSLQLDSAGNLYVYDSNYQHIRKVAPNGDVTTIATTSYYGGSMVLNDNGDLIQTDLWNGKILRKINPLTGVITDFAGSSSLPGYANGLAGAARFQNIGTYTLGLNNKLYISDNAPYIRQVDTSGMVTNFVGSGNPSLIEGVGIDASVPGGANLFSDKLGNIFAASNIRNGLAISKITPSGALEVIYSQTTFAVIDSTPAIIGLFQDFRSPIVDNNANIYFMDGQYLRKLSPNI
ncbi:hypothetical protein [Limnohabitans sp. G3-2]|uniref:hypothetical protein n=1 Tax=Limnohabitans sp. G3-2 TaxID=1100711 RepID=UPI00117B1F6E|nr:hypothetical protein [Limnohabitans sp. G3-2]